MAVAAWVTRAGIGSPQPQSVTVPMALTTAVGGAVSGIVSSLLTGAAGAVLDTFKEALPTFIYHPEGLATILTGYPDLDVTDTLETYIMSHLITAVDALKAGIGQGVGGVHSGLFEQVMGLGMVLQTYKSKIIETGISPILQRYFNRRFHTAIPETGTVINMYSRESISDITLSGVLAELGWSEGWEDALLRSVQVFPSGEVLGDLHQRGIISVAEYTKFMKWTPYADGMSEYLLEAAKRIPPFAEFARMFWREAVGATDVLKWFVRSGIDTDFYAGYMSLLETIPPISDLILFAVREAYPDVELAEQYTTFLGYAKKQGLTEFFAESYWNAHWVLPSPEQAMTMVNREMITEEDYIKLLLLLDVHPDYRENVAALRYIIPPVRDLIRFAVREAFPVAAGEAQYAEFTKYAKAHALSAFWSERYWLAHWELPSIGQVTEMYHRRVIDLDKMKEFLFVADIMEEWRDRLIAISFRPYTRVDVRRMYKSGVLSREDVYDSYLDLGYSPEKAEKMTEWTIVYTTEAERDLTKSEITKGYKLGELSLSDAIALLVDMGYSEDEADYILGLAANQELVKERELTLSKDEALYLNGIISENEYFGRIIDMGYRIESAKQLILLSNLKLVGSPKRLTFGYITGCYREGHLERAELESWMAKNQYPPEDITLVVARESPKVVPVARIKAETAWTQVLFTEDYRLMSETLIEAYREAGYDTEEAQERYSVGMISLEHAIRSFEDGDFLKALEFSRDAESLFKAARTRVLSARLITE